MAKLKTTAAALLILGAVTAGTLALAPRMVSGGPQAKAPAQAKAPKAAEPRPGRTLALTVIAKADKRPVAGAVGRGASLRWTQDVRHAHDRRRRPMPGADPGGVTRLRHARGRSRRLRPGETDHEKRQS